MLYLIAFKIDSSPENKTNFLSKIAELGANISLFANIRVLNCSLNVNDIYDQLEPLLINGDSVFITPISLDNIQGYVSVDIIDWLKEKNQKD